MWEAVPWEDPRGPGFVHVPFTKHRHAICFTCSSGATLDVVLQLVLHAVQATGSLGPREAEHVPPGSRHLRPEKRGLGTPASSEFSKRWTCVSVFLLPFPATLLRGHELRDSSPRRNFQDPFASLYFWHKDES